MNDDDDDDGRKKSLTKMSSQKIHQYYDIIGCESQNAVEKNKTPCLRNKDLSVQDRIRDKLNIFEYLRKGTWNTCKQFNELYNKLDTL